MAGDFIPHQDGAFLEWAKTLLAYVNPKSAAFNIPAGALPPIQAQMTAYEAAFNAAQNPNRGKVDVLTKNEAKEALTASLRAFIKGFLTYNPAVSDADKENMGLPLHDGTRTPAPAPATIPELELNSSIIRQISVHFRDAGSDKRGKPAHVHGVELRWGMLENARFQWKILKIPHLIRQALTRSNLTSRSGGRRYTSAPAGKTTRGTRGLGEKFTRRLFRKI